MATTQLSVIGTPGGRYSFPARTHVSIIFTELSLTGTPGEQHSFSVKTKKKTGHHGGSKFTLWDYDYDKMELNRLENEDELILKIIMKATEKGLLN